MRPKIADESDFLSAQDKAISRFRLKLAAYLALKSALSLAALWGFVWGTAVLALRVAVGIPRRPLLWGLAGVVAALGASIILAWRRAPAQTTVRALLDKQSGSGGLLMAAEDVRVGEWQERMPSVVVPRLRWRGGRAWALFATAVVFVAVSFWVPLRFASATANRPLEVTQEVNQLTEQIETLKEEEIIDSTRADTLQEKLEQVRREAAGEDPAKTWEALDHLEDTLSKTAEEAAQEAVADTEQLTAAETLAEGLDEGRSELGSELMAEAMQELAAMTKATAKDVPALEKHLSEQLQKALQSGKLTPEQLKELAAALRQSKGDIAKRLAKLRDARLVDLKALKACEKAGQCNSAGLAAFLAENKGDGSVSECVGAFCRGGVDRGRGDAAMTWTDGTSEEGAKFKEQVLPPSSLEALKESQLVGVSVGAPTVENAGGSTSGALSGAAAGGGSAHTQVVLPRHKGAVKRYFERPQ